MDEIVRHSLELELVDSDGGATVSSHLMLLARARGLYPSDLSRPRAEFWLGGSLVKVSSGRCPSRDHSPGARGRVRGFSAASRRRLMRALATTRVTDVPLFFTLTYPDSFPYDPSVWLAHRRAFLKRLKRKFPGVGVFWRLEVRRRMSGEINAGRVAPHYHLFVWGLDRIPLCELRAFVSRSWYEVVASGDERHLAAGTRVEQLQSWKGAMAYASKYLGKFEEVDWLGCLIFSASVGLSPAMVCLAARFASAVTLLAAYGGSVGRWWGTEFADCIPWASLSVIHLTRGFAFDLLRLARRHVGKSGLSCKSLTFFCDPAQWVRVAWCGS